MTNIYREGDAVRAILLEELIPGSGDWTPKPDPGTGGGEGTSDHGELEGLADDDHPQYALADGSRGDFEPTGTAAAAVTAHEAAANPHPAYLTQAEADALYHALATDMATQAELNAHIAAADPHPGYLTAAEADAAYQPVGSYPRHVFSNGGTAAVSGTTTETSLLSATYDIPANSLAVGDFIQFYSAWLGTNTTGGTVTFRFRPFFDAVTGASITTSNIANGYVGSGRYFLTARVDAIGASGSIVLLTELFVTGSLVQTELQNHAGTSAGITVNTTQALTFDVRITHSSSSASQTTEMLFGNLLISKAP